jgi:hypothetical protein
MSKTFSKKELEEAIERYNESQSLSPEQFEEYWNAYSDCYTKSKNSEEFNLNMQEIRTEILK